MPFEITILFQLSTKLVQICPNLITKFCCCHQSKVLLPFLPWSMLKLVPSPCLTNLTPICRNLKCCQFQVNAASLNWWFLQILIYNKERTNKENQHPLKNHQRLITTIWLNFPSRYGLHGVRDAHKPSKPPLFTTVTKRFLGGGGWSEYIN